MVHIDCTMGSGETVRGNNHILAICDSFLGYTSLYPIPTPDGKTVARALLKYICIHSMPLKIVTDNGSEFSNQLMSELGLLLGLKHTFMAAYNSKSNGKVENKHKTMQTMVRSYIEDFPNDWDLLIPLVEFALNTQPSEVTKYTPFFIHFGRHPNLPLDSLCEDFKPVISVDDYVKQLRDERTKVVRQFTLVCRIFCLLKNRIFTFSNK